MADKDNTNNKRILLNRKGIKIVSIATISLILAILLTAFIRHGSLVNSKILSDYFFTVGIVLLILSALMRTFAWLVHKRSILKPSSENENDVIKAKIALKLVSKVFFIIGFSNVIMSLVFAVLYYNL